MFDYKTIIINYLKRLQNNDIVGLQNLLEEDVSLNYSNFPSSSSKNCLEIISKWNNNFEVKTVQVSGFLQYYDEANVHILLDAHNLVANENNTEIFPFLYGGKYIFSINERGKIYKVDYNLMYISENTIYAQDFWDNHSLRIRKLKNNISIEKCISFIYRQEAKSEIVKSLTKLFFHCIDSHEFSIISLMIAEKFEITRFKTMKLGIIKGNKENLEGFIKECNAYYDLDTYSIKINRILSEDEKYIVHAQHLTPQRVGTKKLNVATKFHSFFDEDIILEFVEENNRILLENVKFDKNVDIHYNGFQVLDQDKES